MRWRAGGRMSSASRWAAGSRRSWRSATPGKVATLTLMSTSAVAGGESELPGMSAALQASFAADAPAPDWSDRAAVLDHLIADERLYAGSLPYDEPARRELLERVLDRTTSMAAATVNHYVAESGDATPVRPQDIARPTLVLHGTADPLFPFPHGEALASGIAGARLVALEGAGHDLPRPTWDVAIAEILAHTS